MVLGRSLLNHNTTKQLVVLIGPQVAEPCRYGHEAKVVHFLGKVKPWSYSYDTQTGKVKGHTLTPGSGDLHPDFLVQWWNLYSSGVLPTLRDSYGETLFCSGCTEWQVIDMVTSLPVSHGYFKQTPAPALSSVSL
ncbi:glycogenin-1-like isoform X2 [Salvelinus alpinus]|uniref:glycogenin-1-like isoform X2 n=1 Tax=Salvelinus alpinus TaxID=8036 RepID=UPI0039FBEDAB